MQSIFRNFKKSGYVTIDNSLARDSRLSFRARGLIVMVLSHSDEWRVSSGWLESQCTEGREAIRSALEELKRLGYVKYTHARDEGNGRFSIPIWEFHEIPKLPECLSTGDGKPSTASQRRETGDGKSHPQNTIAEYNNQNLASGDEGEQEKQTRLFLNPKSRGSGISR